MIQLSISFYFYLHSLLCMSVELVYCIKSSLIYDSYDKFLPRDAMLARYLLSLCVSVCLSVCLSVCHKPVAQYCLETTGRIELVLTRRLLSTYPTVCCKEIRISLKIRNSVPNSGLRNFHFATASRLNCQQNLSTIEFVDDTYDRRRVVAVYFTSVNCNPLTPLLRFAVWICGRPTWFVQYKLCTKFQLTACIINVVIIRSVRLSGLAIS